MTARFDCILQKEAVLESLSMHATLPCILLLLCHAMLLAEPSSKYEYFFHAWLFSEGMGCSRAALLVGRDTLSVHCNGTCDLTRLEMSTCVAGRSVFLCTVHLRCLLFSKIEEDTPYKEQALNKPFI